MSCCGNNEDAAKLVGKCCHLRDDFGDASQIVYCGLLWTRDLMVVKVRNKRLSGKG